MVDTRPGWEQRLDSLETVAASRSEEERSAQQLVDEEVFKQVFIPRRLNEVAKYDKLQCLHIVSNPTDLFLLQARERHQNHEDRR